MGTFIKKITKVIFILITVAVTGYIILFVYDKIATTIINREIREAGLNPEDYDLRGTAPWNVREYVTQKETEKIEKEGFKSR